MCCIYVVLRGKNLVYLDNAATTKMFEECADVLKKYACMDFYNPSAEYGQAVNISRELDNARKSLLNKLGASKGDVVFTGGATESNNLAVMGSVRNGSWEYVFSAGEHPSVFNVAHHLKELGHIVHFVPLQRNGQVDYDALKTMLNKNTRLISIMHVSNETGVINDLAKISQIRDENASKALFHADGVQAFCKMPFRLDELGVDLYSISAHKFHGPKGVGALYVKNKSSLKNIVYGGGQEGGFRSGTENVAGIKAMQCAFEQIDVAENFEKVQDLKRQFLSIVAGCNGAMYVDSESPYIVSLSFEGVNGETLMRAVEDQMIVGMGSACSAKHAGNRILKEMKFSPDKIKSSIRVSFNAYLSLEDVKNAGNYLVETYEKLLEKVK